MQSERHIIYQAVLEAEKPLVPTQKPIQRHLWIKSDLDSKRKNLFVQNGFYWEISLTCIRDESQITDDISGVLCGSAEGGFGAVQLARPGYIYWL